MSARADLESLAGRYGRRRLAAGLVFAAAIVVAAASIAIRSGAGPAASTALITSALVAAALCLTIAMRARSDPSRIARHLDRSDPSMAESAELLLVDEQNLSLPQRLARRQAERAFVPADHPLRSLPDSVALRMVIAGATVLGAGFLIAFLPRGEAPSLSGPAARGTSAGAPAITRVRIDVVLPAYLGGARRAQSDWDLDVPEGALLTWSVRMSGTAAQAALITSRGDTIALAPDDDGELHGTLRARESAIYRVMYTAGGSGFHRITVRPDAAPAISVLRPAPRTVIPPTGSRVVPLDVLVRDDHGVTSASVIATVTSGAGESVRFRERRLDLSVGRAMRDGTRFSATLNLDTLGMAPGDELYFHVLARDTRQPPNEGRSETVFLALADTGLRTAAEFTGLAVGAGPEYFRSQRQIILDTEKLIADAPRLPLEIFRERANAIGIDQGLLRLRYGEFTGEEFEASAMPEAAHEHDDPENATLLDPETKSTLKGAIAEMWQAELRLRTYRPREALPYERRALEQLKIVQQASRAYVQRVGFEPPPLEPDEKRLTGKLDAIRGGMTRRTALAPRRHDAASVALGLVRELRGGRPPVPGDRAILEAAISELAGGTDAATAANLVVLRELQALADSTRAGRACPACAARSEAALVAALPMPRESPSLAPARGELSRRYFQLLQPPR